MGGDGRDPVADAASVLIRCLAAAEAVVAVRDASGSGLITGTAAESEPPGNWLALCALMIPHREVRVLEWEVRRQVTGTDLFRGGSAANTQGAIAALVSMSATLPREQSRMIETQIERWSSLALALPAVDRLPQWLDGFMGDWPDPDCPYCGHGTLRVNDAVGIVACLKPSCPGVIDGTRLWARVDRDDAGRVVLRWVDGTTQTYERTDRPGRHDAGRTRGVPAPADGDQGTDGADLRPAAGDGADRHPALRRRPSDRCVRR